MIQFKKYLIHGDTGPIIGFKGRAKAFIKKQSLCIECVNENVDPIHADSFEVKNSRPE
jgi:hypothetical protein